MGIRLTSQDITESSAGAFRIASFNFTNSDALSLLQNALTNTSAPNPYTLRSAWPGKLDAFQPHSFSLTNIGSKAPGHSPCATPAPTTGILNTRAPRHCCLAAAVRLFIPP